MTADWSDTWYGAGHWQFSGKLARPEGDIYVSLHVAPGATNLDIIGTKPMEGGLVNVNAAALKGDIGKTGHAAIYGIYFDTAKADVKPESAPALQGDCQVARLQKQFAADVSNMILSKRVADQPPSQGAGRHSPFSEKSASAPWARTLSPTVGRAIRNAQLPANARGCRRRFGNPH